MNDTPKLVRMIGTDICTEINDGRFGLIVPDKDNAIFVPEECVVDCEKSGFRRRELTNSEKLGRIMDLAGELDEPDRVAILGAISTQQQLVWRARQARRAAAT